MVKAPPWGYQFGFITQGINFLVGMFGFLFNSRICMMLIGVSFTVVLLVSIVRYILDWR